MDNSRQIPELQYMVVPMQYIDRNANWFKRRCWTTQHLRRGDRVVFCGGNREGEEGIVVTGRKLKPQTYGVLRVRKVDTA